MAIIAHRFAYKQTEYKINLCGSMSTIQLKNPMTNNRDNREPEKLPLYFGIAGSSIDKFNEALIALLKC